MFEAIRNRQRLMQLILVILIFPAFAFFGLPAYDRFTGGGSIASVGGTAITMQEFEQAQREQMDSMRQSLGDSFDPDLMRTPQAQREVLEGLVLRHTLMWAAHDKKIAVSDEELRQVIAAIPGLTGEDGRFDRERYGNLLAAQGLSEAGFEYQQRGELAMRALPESIGLTALAPKPVIERILRANEQVRKVSVRTFQAHDFLDQVEATDAESRSFYEAHTNEFLVPETIRLEYLLLRPEDVARGIEVDAHAVREYYDQNQARFGTPEERRASHILIDIGDAGSDAARARVEELKAEVEAGKPFEELAREFSDDTASREAGGDLGWFRRDDMITEVADAAFGLGQVGALAGPFQSEFGWHLVRLDGIRESKVKPFEEVREEITEEFRDQQARLRFGEAAEEFSNSVYELPDSLQPTAERLHLEIHTADQVRRDGAPDPDSPLNRPAVLRAIFSPEALAQRQNTEAIEIGNSTLLAARVLEHHEARTPPYEEVEAEVAARVKEHEAARLAHAAGVQALAQAREAGVDAEGFGAEQTISRVSAAALGSAAIRGIFSADPDALPAFFGLEQGDDYTIFRVSGIDDPDAERIAERLPIYRGQAAQLYGQAETAAAVELLRERADVQIHLDRLPAADDADAG